MHATRVTVLSSLRARRVCDGVAAGLWRAPIEPQVEEFRALTPILRALLPQFCHDPVMGQILRLHGPHQVARTARQQTGLRPSQDPAAAARGILLGLALSCLAWIGLALLVPRLW